MMTAKRILAIDGGGIKGALPAAFLATVEEATGKRIVDHFDLIAGTSTGGIIALGIGLGMSATEILEFYETQGPNIFHQDGNAQRSVMSRVNAFFGQHYRSARRAVLPKYNAAALSAALNTAFGEHRLGESQTRLLIPAFDRLRREVHVFKTSHHERFTIDWKESAVNVALATAAAPTYLPSHELENGISLLDGGIWANNPVGLAVVEAIAVLGWPHDNLYVLSLGCSEETAEIPENPGVLGIALKMADIFMLGQSRSALGTAKLLTGDSKNSPRLYRYQHLSTKGEYCLDGASKIDALKGIGVSLAREAVPQLQEVFLEHAREEFIPHHGYRSKAGVRITA